MIYLTHNRFIKYKAKENHIWKLLKHVDSIPELINIYKQIYEIHEVFDCFLSFDRPNKYLDSCAFVLYLQPIKFEFKCFPIHIYEKQNGKCDKDVIALIEQAIAVLKSLGICIKAVATIKPVKHMKSIL